jgi:hypothetical protein
MKNAGKVGGGWRWPSTVSIPLMIGWVREMGLIKSLAIS